MSGNLASSGLWQPCRNYFLFFVLQLYSIPPSVLRNLSLPEIQKLSKTESVIKALQPFSSDNKTIKGMFLCCSFLWGGGGKFY